VTSSHDDLLDLARRLSYMGGLLVGARGYGGYNGGTAGRNDGATSEEAMVTQINAWTSISGLQGSYCSRYRGLRWSGWAWPRRRRVAEEFRRGVARRWGLPSSVSEHGRRQWVAGALVEALPGWRSSEGELALATATAEVRAELGCRCGEEDGAEIGK